MIFSDTILFESSTIISVIGTVLAIILSVAIPLIIKHYLQNYIDKKDAKNAELEQLRHDKRRDERMKEIRGIVVESMEPINVQINDISAKVDSVNDQLKKVEDGALSTLRNDILTCYYRCAEKGYCNDYDYTNIHHMYESYDALQGNSFVADIIRRFDKLPRKEDTKKNLTRRSNNKE
jgi:hypothetical protein